jgi:hypothetical protein
MFGSNFFAEPYYAQGPFVANSSLGELIHAVTRYVKGFKRYTRRIH